MRAGTHIALLSAALVAMVIALFPAASTKADREHVVRRGQSLSAIAARYKVRTVDLAAANKMRRSQTLQAGQVLTVPDAGVIYVQSGQNLPRIARQLNVDVDDLARANKLRRNTPLRVGQRLYLPGHERRRGKAKTHRWGTPRKRGRVKLSRHTPSETIRITLRNDRGRTPRSSLRKLGRIMRHRGSGRSKTPPARLAALLARVSDHFGGRTLHIVSGFRPAGGNTKQSSRHVVGAAVDFRIIGVPHRVIRDYCKTFPRAGVGYYPRSVFTHLDVRSESAYWVDYSRPGQRPMYRRPRKNGGSGGEDAAPSNATEGAGEGT